MRLPEFGVVITEGLPGHGKSFRELSEMLRILTEERRPVFTNLPLRWRVVRAWLRGRGVENLEGLIHPLSLGHFQRFLKRSKLKAEMRDEMRSEALLAGHCLRETTFQKRFEQAHGPDVVAGAGANWVLPLSVIIIDEAHNWFPNTHLSGNKAASEPPELLAYCTMLRHHMHQMRLITQDRAQLPTTFRRLCSSYWHVRQRGEDHVFLGLRLKHIGFSGFGCVRRTPEQEATMGPAGALGTYSEQETIFPWLKSQRWKFRLYDSFTHVGGRRRLMRELRTVREKLGVEAPEEVAKQEVENMWGLVRGLMRVAFYAMVVAMPLALGVAIGRGNPSKEAKAAVVAAAVGKPWFTGLKLSSMTRSGVLLGGQSLSVGGSKNGAQLVRVDLPRKSALFVAGDVGWLWKFGAGEPERIGSVAEVAARAQRVLEARAAKFGGGEPSQGPGKAESVGSPEGDHHE